MSLRMPLRASLRASLKETIALLVATFVSVSAFAAEATNLLQKPPRKPNAKERVFISEHVTKCQSVLSANSHLDRETFNKLLKLYHATGDENIRKRLASSYFELGAKIAREVCRNCKKDTVDEAISLSAAGIIRALDKFDPEYGTKFGTYAKLWIRAEIYEYLADSKSRLKIPSAKWYFERIRKLNALVDMLRSQDPNADISAKALAPHLGLEEQVVEEILEVDYVQRMTFLDKATSFKDNASDLHSYIADQRIVPADEALFQAVVENRRRKVLLAFRSTLGERDRTIWDLHFISEDSPSRAVTGDQLGISAERVRQLIHRIQAQLETFIQGYDPEYLGFNPRRQLPTAEQTPSTAEQSDRPAETMRQSLQ